MTTEKKLLKKEGKKMVSRVRKVKAMRADRKWAKQIAEIVSLTVQKVADGIKFPKIQRIKGRVKARVDFPETQKVEGKVGVDFPEVQKIKGKVKARVIFPKLQKIFGEVIAKVEFPDIQKIVGTVRAKVKFPKVQKIKGRVKADVEFPEVQKVAGKVTTDVPKHRLGKLDVVPIVFWDGKRIVLPDFGKNVTGDGKLYAAVQELSNLTRTQSVFYTGQIRVTTSGLVVALGDSVDIKTLAVQALIDNRDTIHITAGDTQDYELQPGQPLTIVIDNLSKVKMVGSYIDDGVCFAAS